MTLLFSIPIIFIFIFIYIYTYVEICFEILSAENGMLAQKNWKGKQMVKQLGSVPGGVEESMSVKSLTTWSRLMVDQYIRVTKISSCNDDGDPRNSTTKFDANLSGARLNNCPE